MTSVNFDNALTNRSYLSIGSPEYKYDCDHGTQQSTPPDYYVGWVKYNIKHRSLPHTVPWFGPNRVAADMTEMENMNLINEYS